MSWQPIETAPESERILVFIDFGHEQKSIFIARRECGEWHSDSGYVGGRDGPYLKPSQWQSLPEPPQ